MLDVLKASRGADDIRLASRVFDGIKGVLKMWEEDGEIECLEIVLIRDEVQETFF